MREQELNGRLDAVQAADWQQALQRQRQLRALAQSAGDIGAAQHWVQGRKLHGSLGRHGATLDLETHEANT
jgi:hypothetical protein